MKIARGAGFGARGRQSQSGFTLQELLIVAIIMGMLAGLAVIPYRRTIERSRWRAARDILEAIYAGEQVYKTVKDSYCDPNLPVGNPFACLCVTGEPASQCQWSSIYVDNPNAGAALPNTTFTVTVGGGGTTFTAKATRAFGTDPCYNWTLTFDQSRALTPANPSGVC